MHSGDVSPDDQIVRDEPLLKVLKIRIFSGVI